MNSLLQVQKHSDGCFHYNSCTHEAKRINWHPFQTLVALHFSHLQDNNRIRPMYLTLVYNRCAIANVTHKVATTNKRVPFAVHISYDKYTLNLQCLKYAIPTDPEDPLVMSDVKINVRPFTFRKYLNSPPTSSENSTSSDQSEETEKVMSNLKLTEAQLLQLVNALFLSVDPLDTKVYESKRMTAENIIADIYDCVPEKLRNPQRFGQ